MRYQIIARLGRKVVVDVSYDDYDQAMAMLDSLEENLCEDHSIEFKDRRPFRG